MQIGALCFTLGKVVGLCIDFSFTPLAGCGAVGMAKEGFHVLIGHLETQMKHTLGPTCS